MHTDQTKTETNASASNRRSTVKRIVPRRDALLFMALSFALSAPLFLEVRSGLLQIIAAFFFLCGIMFLLAAFDRCKTGVMLFDGGFKQFLGLWPAQEVKYSDIIRIEAVQAGGGDEDGQVYLILHCAGRKVRIGEGDLFSTDLHDIIFNLPGFQRDQYALAAHHKLKGRERLFYKGFVVFEKG